MGSGVVITQESCVKIALYTRMIQNFRPKFLEFYKKSFLSNDRFNTCTNQKFYEIRPITLSFRKLLVFIKTTVLRGINCRGCPELAGKSMDELKY